MDAAGSEVKVVWEGRRVRAFVPDLLAERTLDLDVPSAARAASAAAEIRHAAAALDVEYEPLARLLCRQEGVASSFVEGVTAPVVDIVLAEEQLGPAEAGAARWVAANLTAVTQAVRSAGDEEELSVATLCAWHRTLMTGSPTPERHVGVIRTEQGWIGGTGPFDAHLVTPPPAALEVLLADLVAYVNRTDLDPVAQAAVSHAQFEIIHPFADGNGRLGRVLVAWVLTRRLSLLVPPPVSVAIAADVGSYASGLTLFRLGDHRRWISWFADMVAGGGRAQTELIAHVAAVKQHWRDLLAGGARRTRSDAAVFAALDLLPRHLVLTSTIVSDALGISTKASLATLRRLADLGIVTEHGTLRRAGPGQPQVLFVAPELLGLAGSTPLR